MRWQFADAVDDLSPWSRIEGRKAVTLEEGGLLAPHGFLPGLPRALALEALVQLARWLIVASSGFTNGCVLTGIPRLRVERAPGPGEVLDLSASVSDRGPRSLRVEVRADAAGQEVCSGTLELELLRLEEVADPEEVRAAWESLTRHGRLARSSLPAGPTVASSLPPPLGRG